MRSSYIWQVTFDDERGTILYVQAGCAGEAIETALAAYSSGKKQPPALIELRRRQAIHYRS